jgi:chaperonin GroEL
MSKILIYGDEARQKVLDGVEKLAKTVAVTMGPRGKNVIVGKSIGAPTVTKDGVSVAREVVLRDPIEEQGCQLVKEVAGRTADVAGDGTTTATVLAHEIFRQGKELIDNGYSPLHFRAGMDWALQNILSELETLAQPVDNSEKIKHIATISTNNDQELGGVVAEAYSLAGDSGMVTAEARPGVKSFVRSINGIELHEGYISSAFLDEGQATAILDNCYILIINREMSTFADNAKLFNELAQKHRSLLIIAKDVTKEARKFFALNHTQGRMRVCAIKTPTFGHEQHLWMECLAMLTGATIVDEENGISLDSISINDLGFAKRIEVGKYLTKIMQPKRNEAVIQNTLEIYDRDENILLSDRARKDLQNRRAFLSNKATVITVGYNTELELREKGDRVEDAMFAVRAAMEEGYVPGGGFTLFRVSDIVNEKLNQLEKEYHAGAKVLLIAIAKPAEQIIRNAGLEPVEILGKVLAESSLSFGYNTATGQYGDLVEMGVIDPKKVTRVALQNATSVAQLLITTEAIIVDDPNDQSGWQPQAGYRLPSDGGLNHKY